MLKKNTILGVNAECCENTAENVMNPAQEHRSFPEGSSNELEPENF